ncbi:hypothetical protein CXQ85_002336 [Candidozyma haemuli]|uniref:Uncharacterized protein n=1 Tax=Candidozyma haemuli TaxID=45357 RepID=A0A2V1AS20_9ASCO|nr:hypothetical protein CXQ85_002336 [[Candida] haemuloni]PVH20542.1 hypothetical protein CXQ85_002336 [[Candida] haemuloni]
MITPTFVYPPQPSTARATSSFLSYDPQNNRIAYASGRSIIVRSLDSDKLPIQFTKHIFPTTVATFSPSGNYVASGDESGNVKIWDTSVYGKEDGSFEQPTVKAEYQILSGPIRSIAWDADNQRVIAVGQGKDRFGHCFTWDTGNSVGEIQGHSETITAVDIRQERPYRVCTAGVDMSLVLYTGPPYKFDRSIRSLHTNTVRDVKYSPDGQWLVSGGSDRAIALFDGKTGDSLSKPRFGHDGSVFAISWFPNSSAFVTASSDNTLKAWDPKSCETKHTYTVESPPSVSNQQVGLILTKEYAVSLSLNGNLNFFKHTDSTPSKIWYGHQKTLTAVASDDKYVYTGDSDGLLIRWEKDGDQLNQYPEILGSREDQHTNFVRSVISSNGNVLTAAWDDKLKLWKSDGTLVKSVELEAQPKHAATLEKLTSQPLKFKATYVSPLSETNVLVANKSGNRIEELRLDSGLETVRSYEALRSSPTLIKVSPDGKYAAVADTTGKYTLYNTSDGSVVTTRWAFHNSRVEDAEWTEDSQFLLSGGLDSGIFIYSVARPMKVLKFPLAHQNGVTGLSWLSYDKKEGSFVSTGSDGVVKTWSVDFSAYA